jgi:hypothetical protein
LIGNRTTAAQAGRTRGRFCLRRERPRSAPRPGRSPVHGHGSVVAPVLRWVGGCFGVTVPPTGLAGDPEGELAPVSSGSGHDPEAGEGDVTPDGRSALYQVLRASRQVGGERPRCMTTPDAGAVCLLGEVRGCRQRCNASRIVGGCLRAGGRGRGYPGAPRLPSAPETGPVQRLARSGLRPRGMGTSGP